MSRLRIRGNDGYQDADIDIVDYRLTEIPDGRYTFRGRVPRDLAGGNYFTCLGAAQTFGRFVQNPFPELLSRFTGIDALNLGMAGAGPEDFLRNGALIEHAKRGRFAVVQVMSGRSVRNSMFDSPFGGVLVRTDISDAEPQRALQAWDALMAERDQAFIERLVEETRENYIHYMTLLLQAITVPKILLWISRRAPAAYESSYRNADALFGPFPQLVDETVLSALKPHADLYCESTLDLGLPQTLRSRHDRSLVPVYPNNPIPHENGYYPSPEMHINAAVNLYRTLAESGWMTCSLEIAQAQVQPEPHR